MQKIPHTTKRGPPGRVLSLLRPDTFSDHSSCPDPLRATERDAAPARAADLARLRLREADTRDERALFDRAGIGPWLERHHARTLATARGSKFWLCGRGAKDPRYPEVPALRVVRCAGWERRDDGRS